MSHICCGLTLPGHLTIGPQIVVSYVGVLETFYIVAMFEIVDLVVRQFRTHSAAKTESTTFFPLALS